ncbi:MAG TPA: histidine--tRNA ligase [Candidatus Hydrogenedentes bacterium]|nr:histidine--tRNA ligase [Candidatus Hydrogenedentota bacterium]HOM47922.1 histidine--tRNA ligase [Candidatus Hydrogenedentota bacterium]HOR51407.1 histidine--tRNA ligase [Candidatus Hydrogenedentota bacterium]HPK24649.1 histidine--tRNA ligase [Candidatus Hydrogenedentota bacterium]
MKAKLVKPQNLKGFQDQLPEDMLVRRRVIETIQKSYELFGFLPLDTPVMESFETLMGAGGTEIAKEIFRLQTPEEEEAALRFDLTVPFARVISQYRDRLKLPFRRYHMGPVFRADKPGPGRFRQFTQFDIDIAGARTIAADAEVVAVLCHAMNALGLTKEGAPLFRIRISNRVLLDALLDGCGIEDPEKVKHILRVIDKLQKVGIDNVRKELGEGRIDDSGDPIPGVHLSEDTIEIITRFVEVATDSRERMIEKLEALLPQTKLAEEALAQMRELHAFLTALDVSEEEAVFDPSLTRGLDYYTGPVFEIEIPACREVGSVGGGGRYNRLCSRFLSQDIPATGASIGLDRLLAALSSLGLVTTQKSNVQVCIATVGKVARDEVLKIASELRAAGISTMPYLGNKKNMGDQLSNADSYDIPVAVIIGEDELQRGEVSVKNLIQGKEIRQDIKDHDEYRQAGTAGQQTVARTEMVSVILRILSSLER